MSRILPSTQPTTRTLVLLVLLLGICTPGLAQKRPDFSGHWVSQSTPAGRGADSGSRGSGWGSSFTIKQGPETLTVEREFFSAGDLQPVLKFQYMLDGSEGENSVLMGRGIQKQTSRVRWDRERLTITTTYPFANPENGQNLTGEIRQTLWLEPARMLAWSPSLVVETTRVGVLGGPSSTSRTVYSRRP